MTLDTIADSGVSTRSGGQTSHSNSEPAGSNKHRQEHHNDQSFSAHLERQSAKKPGKTVPDEKQHSGSAGDDSRRMSSDLSGEIGQSNSDVVAEDEATTESGADVLAEDDASLEVDRQFAAVLPVQAGEVLPQLGGTATQAGHASEVKYAGGTGDVGLFAGREGAVGVPSATPLSVLHSVSQPARAGAAQTTIATAPLIQLGPAGDSEMVSPAPSASSASGMAVPVIANAAKHGTVASIDGEFTANSSVVAPDNSKLDTHQLAQASRNTMLSQHMQRHSLSTERAAIEAGSADEFGSEQATANSRERSELLSPSGQALKSRFSAHANADWSGLIRDQVMFVRSGALTFARIELDPVELGPLDLQMHVRGSEVSVSILAQPQTRELLDAHAQRIRDALAAQGFEQVELQIDSASSHPSDSGDSSGNEHAPRDFDVSADSDESVEVAQIRVRNERLLDAFV